MACEIIDLDKYQCINDLVVLNQTEANYSDFNDYHIIDAEIIDYGISEDQEEEFEKPKPTLELPALPFAERILRETSVNVSNIPSIYKNRRVCIKVVDCDKYPWYYTKYEKQIIKTKYSNALKHTASIVKCLNNSAEDSVINVDELSDSEDDSKDQSMHKRASNFWKSSLVEQQYIKQKEKKKNLADGELKNMLKEAIEKGTNKLIDIKKNKGLIGMKVKRIEITYKENRKQKKKSYKIHLSKKKHNQKRSLEKIVCAAECDNYNNENEIQDCDRQELGKSQLKNFSNLTCSLKITSPKIYMKIKKNVPKNEVVENLRKDAISDIVLNTAKASENYKDSAASSITTKEHELKKLISSHRKETQYKPMPKSKKNALQQRTSEIIDHNSLNIKREIVSIPNTPNKNSLVVPQKNVPKNEVAENLHNDLISVIVTNTTEVSENNTEATASSITTKNQEVVKSISSHHKETKYKPMPKSKKVAFLKHTSSKIDQNKLNKNTKFVSCLNDLNKSTPVAPQHTTDSIKNKTTKLKKDKNNFHDDSISKKGKREMIAKPTEEPEPERFESVSMIKNIDNQSPVLLSSKNKKLNNVLKLKAKLTSSLITVAKMDGISKSHNEIHHVKKPKHNISDSVSSEKTNIIIPNLSPSSKSNENQSSIMSINKDVIFKTQTDNSLHFQSPFNNDGNSERSKNPNIQTLLTLPQNLPKPQEYILPDVIHPAKESENHLKDYQASSNSPVLLSLINKPVEKSKTNTNHISMNSQSSMLFRAPIIPNTRPNILRQPNYKFMSHGSPVRQQYSSAQVLPPFNRSFVDRLPFNRPSFFRPPFNRPPPPPYAQRPQSLKIVRPREYYPYFRPSIIYPPTAANKLNRQDEIHYIQHNYPQQSFCNGENIQNPLNNAHEPPGICNVLPKYCYLPQNLYNPAYPPPPPPPTLPVEFTITSDHSSIIEKNTSGTGNKINILSTANKESCVNAILPKNKKANRVTNNNTQKNILDNTNTALTKSEMMKELQMALMAEIEESIQKESNKQCIKETSKCKEQNPVSETVKALCKGSFEERVRPALPASFKLELELDSKNVTPIIDSLNQKLEVSNEELSFRETMNLGPKRKNHEMEQVLKATKLLKMNTEMKQPQSELIHPELNKPLTNDPRTKQNNILKGTTSKPLQKKLKSNDLLTTQHRITTKRCNNGYSPPILPIPTYQNILSELHVRPSNRKLLNSYVAPNINKKIAKKGLQNNLTETCKLLKSPTYDTKKISLDEYKKRSTKQNSNNK